MTKKLSNCKKVMSGHLKSVTAVDIRKRMTPVKHI